MRFDKPKLTEFAADCVKLALRSKFLPKTQLLRLLILLRRESAASRLHLTTIGSQSLSVAHREMDVEWSMTSENAAFQRVIATAIDEVRSDGFINEFNGTMWIDTAYLYLALAKTKNCAGENALRTQGIACDDLCEALRRIPQKIHLLSGADDRRVRMWSRVFGRKRLLASEFPVVSRAVGAESVVTLI